MCGPPGDVRSRTNLCLLSCAELRLKDLVFSGQVTPNCLVPRADAAWPRCSSAAALSWMGPRGAGHGAPKLEADLPYRIREGGPTPAFRARQIGKWGIVQGCSKFHEVLYGRRPRVWGRVNHDTSFHTRQAGTSRDVPMDVPF